MSERSHLYLPLIDSSGILYPFARVSLLDPTTGNQITDPIYPSSDSLQFMTQPFLCQPGVIDVWVDDPQRVTVVAALPGDATWTMAGVDLLPAPDTVVTTGTPLTITTPAAQSAAAALVASEDQVSATWQVIGLFQVHQHAGDSANGMVLGEMARDFTDDQTWLGVGAGGAGDQGSDTTALGSAAAVHDAQAVAVGASSAASAQAVALGGGASAMGAAAVAVGGTAQAPQAAQSVLGAATSATDPQATVVGAAAAAGTAVELGSLLQLSTGGGGLVGAPPEPSTSGLTGAPFTVINGNVVIPGGGMTRVLGNAVMGHTVATAVATHGAAGAAPMVVDTSTLSSSTAGYTAILSLVSALSSLGLVYNATGSQVNDTFTNLSKTSSHASGINLDTSNPSYFDGRTSRVNRTGTDTPQSITYSVTSPQDFAVLLYVWPQSTGSVLSPAQLAVSATTPGGIVSVALLAHPLVATGAATGWSRTWVYPAQALPSGTTALTFTMENDSNIWSPEIGQLIIR